MVWYLLPIANVIHLWINFYDTPTAKLEGVLGIMDSFCYYHYYGPWYLVDHLSAVPINWWADLLFVNVFFSQYMYLFRDTLPAQVLVRLCAKYVHLAV